MNSKPRKPYGKICKCVGEDCFLCDWCDELHPAHCFTAPLVDCCDTVKVEMEGIGISAVHYCKTCKPIHDVKCSRKKRKLSLEPPCLNCGTAVQADPWSSKEFPGDKWMCFPCFRKSERGKKTIPPAVPACDCDKKYHSCKGSKCKREDVVHDVRKLTKFFDCCGDACYGIWLCSECAEEHMEHCEGEEPRCSPCLVCGKDVRAHEWYAVEFHFTFKKWICFECMKD